MSAIWRTFFGQWRGMCGNVCCAPRPNETGYAGCMSGIVGLVSLVELNRRARSANRRKTLTRKTQRGACADAVRCDGHRSTLHQASQRTALFEARCRPLGWRVVVGTPEGGGAVLLLAPCCLVMPPEEDQRIPFPVHSQGSMQVYAWPSLCTPAVFLPLVMDFAQSVIQFRTAAAAPILGVRLSHRYSF